MIDFEEELKKFHPSLEVEDAEDAIFNQDLTDMADILIKMIDKMKPSEEYEKRHDLLSLWMPFVREGFLYRMWRRCRLI